MRRGALTVKFSRGARAERWLVTLRSGGRRLELEARRPSLVIRGLTWTPRTVSIVAVDRFGRRSPTATGTVRAARR